MRYSLLAAIAVSTTLPSAASAQEFRIVTTVRDLNQEAESGVSTLTLFRQNKVYDYIHTLGEVIIFEPGANQFTILNVRRSMATTVNFDEVKKLLSSREPEIQRYVAQLRSRNDPAADEAAKAFEFQLNPKFEEMFDADQQTLHLSGPSCTYTVRCAEAASPEHINRYLTYADWIARLNSVLHPRAMFPEPRLVVNKALRRHQKLPIRVELQFQEADVSSQPAQSLHLAAEHRIAFRLENRDRSQITAWEAALASPRITRKTFRSYQEAVLAAR